MEVEVLIFYQENMCDILGHNQGTRGKQVVVIQLEELLQRINLPSRGWDLENKTI